jgi:hypothetical protein
VVGEILLFVTIGINSICQKFKISAIALFLEAKVQQRFSARQFQGYRSERGPFRKGKKSYVKAEEGGWAWTMSVRLGYTSFWRQAEAANA